MSRQFNAVIALGTGEFFTGLSGFPYNPIAAELCFTTSLTGYQEVMTDPSYSKQMIVFAFPHIGNVGTTPLDSEHQKVWASAFIMGEPITAPSNFRSKESLYSFLVRQEVPFIWSTDTRALVKCISQTSNPVKAAIYSASLSYEQMDIKKLVEIAKSSRQLSGQFLSKPFLKEHSLNPFPSDTKKPRIALLDFGAKESIRRKLENYSVEIEVLPFDISPDSLVNCYDGIVISNGPGDPTAIPGEVIESVQILLRSDIPILGICLGYQIIAKALGAQFRQLGCGHHGTNHPVKDLLSGKVLITSQNHEFVMDEEEIPDSISITHRSLFDDTPEGFRLVGKDVHAYQFHPEASPGPIEGEYLLEAFVRRIS